MNKYTMYEDPGHGWLEVPRSVCAELGILDKISPYSYQSRDGSMLYLEEDCDFSVFCDALNVTRGSEVIGKQIHTNHDSFVRSLPGYRR